MRRIIKEETAAVDITVCATCQQQLRGAYCSHCGEKKLDKHDRRIVHILGEFFHALTHADGKFLRSLKYLLTRPGFLTSEYLAGRRMRYSSPLSLFLIANLLYLLIAYFDTFNSRFDTIVEGQPYSEALAPQVHNKMEAKRWSRAQLEERYNEKSSHEAKLLLIVFVFLVSVPAALLFISRKRYYYDYVIFSLEYVNFILYGIMLLLPWLIILPAILLQLLRQGGRLDHLAINLNGYVVYSLVLLLLWVYLTVATRRVFRQRWWLTILKSGILTICTVAAMFLYRLLAFEVTMFLL